MTVTIPAYNAEEFLARCLESLLLSEYRDETELLVIDDGSKDKTGEIADGYAEKYPGIVQVIHKENGGHGSGINAGIRAATGKYFRVVDSDDAVEPEAYHAYLQRLARLDCDLVVTPFACVRESGKEQVVLRQVEGAQSLCDGVVTTFKKAAEHLHVRMHEWTIRTSILKEHAICMSEHSFYVDMQYIMFPVPWIDTICLLNLPVYRYRLGDEGQSVSVKNMQKNRWQHQRVLDSLVEFYKERMQAGDAWERLSYLARGIAKMQANQVQIILSLPMGKAAKQELKESERKLRQECPAAYAVNEKRSLWLLRKSRYMLYRVAAVAWRIIKR